MRQLSIVSLLILALASCDRLLSFPRSTAPDRRADLAPALDAAARDLPLLPDRAPPDRPVHPPGDLPPPVEARPLAEMALPDQALNPDLLVSKDLAGPTDQAKPKDTMPPKADMDKSCTSNLTCSSSEFCDQPGCKTVGVCTKTPAGCVGYDPVCGCDKKDYPSSCAAHQARTSVAFSGTCCDALQSEYLTLIASLKVCCFVCAIISECTFMIASELACPCQTYVNPPSNAVLTKIQALKNEWASRGCTSNCPAANCPSVSSGTCTTTNRCVDLP